MAQVNSRDRLVGADSELERVEQLLERYPATSEAEGREIVTFLQGATPLEVGLLSANAAAWTKAEQYKSDHPQHFRTSARTWAALIGLTLAVVTGIILMWDAGVR